MQAIQIIMEIVLMVTIVPALISNIKETFKEDTLVDFDSDDIIEE